MAQLEKVNIWIIDIDKINKFQPTEEYSISQSTIKSSNPQSFSEDKSISNSIIDQKIEFQILNFKKSEKKQQEDLMMKLDKLEDQMMKLKQKQDDQIMKLEQKQDDQMMKLDKLEDQMMKLEKKQDDQMMKLEKTFEEIIEKKQDDFIETFKKLIEK